LAASDISAEENKPSRKCDLNFPKIPKEEKVHPTEVLKLLTLQFL